MREPTGGARGVRPPPSWLSGLPVHYAWVVVGVGVLVTASCLGVARFAFGMILPSMGDGLLLSRQEMGLVSTGSFVGYLVGAFCSGQVARRIGARATILASLLVIGGSIVLVALSSSFWQVFVTFTFTGLGSGTGNVACVGLVSHWFLRSVRGRAAGVVVTGSGYAMMLSGVIMPPINGWFGPRGWRVSWVVLAVLVTVTALLALLVLRDEPEQIGLAPVGHAVRDAGHQVHVSPAEQRRATIHLGLIYASFGFSYIIYATFLVTTLVRDRGFSEAAAGWIWFAVGFFSIFSGPLFGALSDGLGRRLGLAASFGCHALAYALVGFSLPTVSLYLSVLIFGLSAWSIPGIMGAAAGDYMGPAQAVQSLGTLTVFMGVGQAVGPAVAGVLGERSGTFASSYLLAAATAGAAVVLCLALRPPSTAAQTPGEARRRDRRGGRGRR